MSGVLIAGITLSIFLGIAIFMKKNVSIANKILRSWLFILGIVMVLFYFENYNHTHNYPYPVIFIFRGPIALLHGPLLFLYISYFTDTNGKFKMSDYLHFLPFLIAIIIINYEYFSNNRPTEFFNKLHITPKYILVRSIVAISIILYAFFSFRKIKFHNNKIQNNYSGIRKISINWARFIIIVPLLISLINMFVFILKFDDNYSSENVGNIILYLMVTIYIFISGLFGIKQESFFTKLDVKPKLIKDNRKKEDDSTVKKDYRLKSEFINSEYVKLLELFEKRKPYLQCNITLSHLASMIGTNEKYLSQIINSSKMNFFELINSYRIREFKERIKLDCNKNENIISIAYECGFSSKTSFNRAFKKLTGVTPTEYRKGINIKKS